jgi:hypothetical protein
MPSKALSPDLRKPKTIFFRVTVREYEAAAQAAHDRNMLLSEWARRVLQQKLGMEETV